MKVDLGCGQWFMPGGYLRLDLRSQVAPDVVADFRILPFKKMSVSELYVSHVLEHCSFSDIPCVLKEWARVLKEEGILNVTVPNATWGALEILKNGLSDYAMKVFYGGQDYDLNFHKSCFTEGSLRQYLENMDFKVMFVCTQFYNINVKAIKKNNYSEI